MTSRFARSGFLAGAAAAVLVPRAARAQQLDALLRDQIDQIPAVVGVYARTMAPDGILFAYNAGLSFPSASTIKLLIMLTAFRAAESDPRVMNEPIVLHAGELIGGSDFLANAQDGQRFRVRELIVPMIQVSDNTAANLLISHFGFARINAVTRAAGLYHTTLKRHFLDAAAIVRHMDNRTTPADMAHLLYQIERGAREGIRTVASPDSCRAMIRIMLGQTDRDKIPAGLPPGIPVANKTGELSRSRDDVAIVEPFGDSPYVLSVYTKDLNDWNGGAYGIADISRLVYRRVAGTNL